MRWILLLLPWVELYTLIQLGSRIGALATLAYVFLTLVLGVSILRLQGMEIIARLRSAQAGGIVMERLLADDLAVGLAGVLLLVPGLVTDALAVMVLVGPLWRRLTGRHRRAGGDGWQRPGGGPFSASRGGGGPDDPIEGDFRRLDDD